MSDDLDLTALPHPNANAIPPDEVAAFLEYLKDVRKRKFRSFNADAYLVRREWLAIKAWFEAQTPDVQEKYLAALPAAKPKVVEGPKTPRLLDSAPDVVKRRAIVAQNILLSTEGLCALFDAGSIPLTPRMREALTWANAYKSSAHRHGIEVLVSRDKKVVKV